ncbi:MAG: hypothetical protein LQ348_004815 [Seirophora lacunosa]|nr:MAG: hypothetical protein LQ348_004815 [Seirophora lacunosa]
MYAYKRVSTIQVSSPATPADIAAAAAAAATPFALSSSTRSTSVWAGPEASTEVTIAPNDRIEYISVREEEIRAPLLPAASSPPAEPTRSLKNRLSDEYKFQVRHTKPKVDKIKKEVKKKGKDIKAKGQENAKKLGKKVKGFVVKLAEKAKGQ